MRFMILIYALALIGASVALAPRCEPDTVSFHVGGMLVGGCR